MRFQSEDTVFRFLPRGVDEAKSRALSRLIRFQTKTELFCSVFRKICVQTYCCSVDDSCIRSKTASFSFENGLVWTGPKKLTCFKYIVCGFRKLTAVSYSVQGSNTSKLCLKTSFQVF